MLRKSCLLILALILIPSISSAETIDVQIKGVDDGVKTTKQQDYKEAVLFAKREAIERAGVKVKALTTAKDFVVHSDYIESEAEAVLLPGYNIIDMGYAADGTYQVVLIGKVKTVSKKAESIDSKELRYARSLVERGNTSEAKKIITDIINNRKDDEVVAEAMYCQVLWKFTDKFTDEIDTFEKLKAYYPNSKYVGRLENLLKERDKEREKVVAQDGHFIKNGFGVVYDKNTGLEWYAGPDRDTSWDEAKSWAEHLTVAGGGWRMPMRKELKTLYNKGGGMLPVLHNTGWWVWSDETKGSLSAWLFNFDAGGEASYRRGLNVTRGFAVRSRK